MRARWWIASVLAVLVIGAGLALRHKPAPVTPPRQSAVTVPVTGDVTVQGKIRPQHVVGVAAGVPGFIEALLVDRGEEVFQGQVLARIGAQSLESNRENAANALERAQEQVTNAETALAGARLESSRADADGMRSRLNLERAEKFYNRQQALFREGATPRLTFQKAEVDYEAAKKDFEIMDTAVRSGREHMEAAQKDVDNARKLAANQRAALEEAQNNMAASEVHSPVDGYVVAREGEVGKSAEEVGNRLFTIASDLFALEVVLEPKDEVLKRIIPGMPATVNVLDLDSAAFQGTVKEIKDKEHQAIVEFVSANPGVKPGMIADVRFKFQ
ncbi:MAG TPA: biotin/lipoyl-binding protein [Candidatus Acidoferrum sp.]|nr:biotin/lipoyl-binding protein [Candidatus Acidoferrum sp.]